METIYRTLLIIDKNTNNLVYGHSIEWKMSCLDFFNKEWKSFEKGALLIFYKDFDNNQYNEKLLEDKGQSTGKDNIKYRFNHDDKTDLFLELSSSEHKEFNPFIEYPCKKKVYYNSNYSIDEIQAFIKNNRKALEIVSDKYKVNLIKYPTYINTFSFISPTRITIRFKGFKEGSKSGFTLKIWDEFGEYSMSDVKLILFQGESITEEKFILKDNRERFDVGFIPDRTIIEIIYKGILIYKSDNYILKSIVLDMHVESKQLVMPNGEKLTTYDKISIKSGHK